MAVVLLSRMRMTWPVGGGLYTISTRPVMPLCTNVLSPITLTTRRACSGGKTWRSPIFHISNVSHQNGTTFPGRNDLPRYVIERLVGCLGSDERALFAALNEASAYGEP